MLAVWCLLFALTTTSETVIAPGTITLLKTAMDHIDKLTSSAENPPSEPIAMESRFIIEPERPKTLAAYINNLSNIINVSNTDYGGRVGNIVVVTRIGDYDKIEEADWKDLSQQPDKNNSSKDSTLDTLKNDELVNGLDYSLDLEEVQKYIDDYQDLLFTFKDFIKIGNNPNVKVKIAKNNLTKVDSGKKFNVTYIMPIEKSKKYFEIKLNNLTETQYNEINQLLQEHMKNKSKNSNPSNIQEDEILYVDIDSEKRQVRSRALTQSNVSPDWSSLQQKLAEHSASGTNWPMKPEEAAKFINRVFTEEGYIDFFNGLTTNLKNISTNYSTSSDQRMKNNGFHAPIVTDYLQALNNVTDPLEGNSRTTPLSNSDDPIVATATTMLNPVYFRRTTPNITTLHSKRPVGFLFNATQYRNTPDQTFLMDQQNSFGNAELGRATIPIQNTPFSGGLSVTEGKNKTETVSEMKQEISIKNIEPNNQTPQNSENINMYNNFTTNKTAKGDDISNSLNLMQAAYLILEMKKKIEEDEKNKNERYKNYIKTYLTGEENTKLPERDDDGKVMKINRQDDILEELKQLMLSYFATMNFNNALKSTEESIRNATNIFELMEQSSQLVKSNLIQKLQFETKEPTGFVKRIFNSQVEKCKQFFNSSKFTKVSKKSPDLFERNSYRFLIFTKCINNKLQKCIQGFRMWLQKGKFYLRPQLKLDRAYERYEIERNLYCLRTYNAAYLASNRHGVKMKLEPRVHRKSGTRRLRPIQRRKSQQLTKTNGSERSAANERNKQISNN